MDRELADRLAIHAGHDFSIGQQLTAAPASDQISNAFLESARSSGDGVETARRLARILADRPDDPGAHLDYIQALSDCRRPEQALQAARVALERFPGEFMFAVHGAYLAGAAFEFDTALDFAKLAWSLRPGHGHCFNVMNRALQNTGRFAELKDFLEGLLAQEPDHAEARKAKARLEEDSAIFFIVGIEQINVAIKDRDWLLAERSGYAWMPTMSAISMRRWGIAHFTIG